MTKIVYNDSYGGFGLSHEAILRYAEIKGIKLYPEKKDFVYIYWTVPPEEREKNDSSKLDVDCINRTDQALVQVIEELGNKANDGISTLKIIDLPKGTYYLINEYDGLETVETDWEVA